jgi:hypothetical protein
MSRNRGFFAGRHPRVIGHRGSAGTAPENTMISFEFAAAIGVDVLETDIHMTKDKFVVVCAMAPFWQPVTSSQCFATYGERCRTRPAPRSRRL